MSAKLLNWGWVLMVPVSTLGLLWQQSFLWVVCPQALVVMFVRQSWHPFDSLGAAGYPDLAVAALYYPSLGLILSRAAARNRLRPVALRAAVWHVVAIGLAGAAAELRNRL